MCIFLDRNRKTLEYRPYINAVVFRINGVILRWRINIYDWNKEYECTIFKKRQKAQKRAKTLLKQGNILRNNTSKAEILVTYIAKTIRKFFPNLREEMNKIPDSRKAPKYSMPDVIFAVIAMFFLKKKSRNGVNLERKKRGFGVGFKRIFNYNIPHMDTVDGILKKIEPVHLEQVHLCLVKSLIAQKTLHPFRILSAYHIFSIDGVKIMSFSESVEGTTKKVSKKGKVSYTRSCIQLKITTINGFSIPVMTEWISTEDGSSKEDCELNAFKRLSKRIKKFFPKLKICLVLDGLYANDSVFTICTDYNWAFSVTLKSDSLKTLWRKIYTAVLSVIYPENALIPPSEEDGGSLIDDIQIPNLSDGSIDTLYRTLEWCNNLNYKGHTLRWFACKETTGEAETSSNVQYFAWLTNIKITSENILEMEKATRSGRSGIEDSFNSEKNRGYAMKHKFSRKSFRAGCNYITCMHIAEIFNQLVTLSIWFQKYLRPDPKDTEQNIWGDLFAEIRNINESRIIELSKILPHSHCYL